MKEPIAIIGIGCRFPGGVSSPETFWQFLLDQGDAITEVPPDRFDLDTFYDARPATPGKVMSRWGGYLDQVDQFDPFFFGISPREAERMDPQQRLLLEIAWEALEDAGQVPNTPAVQQTGVFVGMWLNDYEARLFRDPAKTDFYMTTGSGRYSASGRLSYVLGLQGPSLTLDTACSSSLVAVHLAVQSLRAGECDLALAGGANVILQPQITIAYSQSRMMAPDGHCKFGDARANGYVRSEGAGLVVLKRLAEALADGDPIYAVIRGSATNNDGRSSGFLTTPGGAGQEEMLRKAYANAEISPGAVQYVEAHGTGTLAGDPVEIGALGAVLGQGRPVGEFCAVGSVKTNFGHTEGAAGVAGLIKVALALKHRVLPASLHFQSPNPAIPWETLPVRIQAEAAPWPAEVGLAVGGVSAFGIAGTNAHVVLQEAPELMGVPATSASAYLLPLSAHTPEALQARAQDFLAFLPQTSDVLPHIGYTAALRRSHHEYRLVLVGRSREDWRDQLTAFVQGEKRPGLVTGFTNPRHQAKLAFVFPGQGGQWLGMGRELLAQEPAFREAIERCEVAMQPYVDWSLLEQLTADEAHSRLAEIDVAQPMIFAIQVALAALWRSWGVEPHAVVGHSLGEVAAAQVAGVLSLEDAAHIICRRSQLMKQVSGRGAMAVVDLGLEEAQTFLKGYEGQLSIAVNNSPRSTVISGDPAALEAVMQQLQQQDIFCRLVKVDVAAHSPHMEPLHPELVRSLSGLRAYPATTPIYSTVTGAAQDGAAFDADYWGRNLRQPVLFSAAAQHLIDDGCTIFVEIGPHPVLLPALAGGWPKANLTLLPSLRRDEDETLVMRETFGGLHCAGYPVDWQVFYPAGQLVRLPRFPWQRERFWLDVDLPTVARSQPGAVHPLLGWRVTLGEAPERLVWENILDKHHFPHLYDYQLQGLALLPTAAYLELALAAARTVYGVGAVTLADIAWSQVLVLPDEAAITIQTVLIPTAADMQFRIYSQTEFGDWVLHVTGTIRSGAVGTFAVWAEAEVLQSRAQVMVDGEFYEALQQKGVTVGETLRCLTPIWHATQKMLGQVSVPNPALGLESGFQLAAIGNAGEPVVYAPNYIREVRVLAALDTQAWNYAQLCSQPEVEHPVQDLAVFDDQGRVLAEIEGVRLQPVDADSLRLEDWFYALQWQPQAVGTPTAAVAQGDWLILADQSGVGETLAAQLQAQGERGIRVYPGESYVQLDDGCFQIRPEQAEDWARLFRDAFAGRGPAEIVYLWGLDLAAAEALNLETLTADQTVSCDSVLSLVKHLAQVEWENSPQLWLVTCGVQAVTETDTASAVTQAPLWGLGRVIAEEQRDLWGGLIDLAADEAAETVVNDLLQAVRYADGENQVAYRQGQRYVARFVHPAQPDSSLPAIRFRADASYLITGGLGGIALRVARWLVENGARRLILLGRTPLPPRQEWNQVDPQSLAGRRIQAVRELEAAGASIHLAAVDVTDTAQLTAYLEAFQQEGWPAIRGVMHTAAVIEDRLLTQLDSEAFRYVLGPKVNGGWALHQQLPDLDFFVVFSSVGSVLGQTGQGNYAAANAFLDGLAAYRRAHGQPALSVNWGGWSDLGLAMTAGAQRTIQSLEAEGIHSFTPAQGIAALEHGLRLQAAGSPAAQMAVLPINWVKFRETHALASVSRLLVDFMTATPAEAAAVSVSGSTRDELLAVEPEQRQPILESYLQKRVAEVLKLDPRRIELFRPLGLLGVDSLMALEIRRHLEADLGVPFSATLVWNYPTIAEMAPHVAGKLGISLVSEQRPAAAATSPATPAGERLGNVFDDLDSLSDEDALNQLMGKK